MLIWDVLALLHPRPSADGFECWFLRQAAALFQLRHRHQSQFLTHQRFIFHRKGWAGLTASQGASRGLTQALQEVASWQETLTRFGGGSRKKRMLIKWRRHAARWCSAPWNSWGIITWVQSPSVECVEKMKCKCIVRLCDMMNLPLPSPAGLMSHIVNNKWAKEEKLRPLA